MSNTDREQVRKATQEAVEATSKAHQQWHWDTGNTNCPWGCGDGSGINAE